MGRTLYEKFIEKYNEKMWLVNDNRRIDTFNWSPKDVTIKSGPRAACDTAMSAYPYAPDGYNRYFDVSVEGVTVLLSTKIERATTSRNVRYGSITSAERTSCSSPPRGRIALRSCQ